MSQSEADTRARLVDSTLHRELGISIETGVIKKPSVADGEHSRTMFVVAKIAKALDVSVDDLLS